MALEALGFVPNYRKWIMDKLAVTCYWHWYFVYVCKSLIGDKFCWGKFVVMHTKVMIKDPSINHVCQKYLKLSSQHTINKPPYYSDTEFPRSLTIVSFFNAIWCKVVISLSVYTKNCEWTKMITPIKMSVKSRKEVLDKSSYNLIKKIIPKPFYSYLNES